MVKVFSRGKTAKNTRATSLTTDAKDKECSPGKMAVSMKESGKKVSNTARVHLVVQMAKKELASGKTEETSNG